MISNFPAGFDRYWRMLKKSVSTPFIPQSWGNIEAGGYPQTPTRRFPGPLFRQSILNNREDFVVVGEAKDGAETQARFGSNTRPGNYGYIHARF